MVDLTIPPGISNGIIQTLNYANALLVVLYFIVARIYTWCTLRAAKTPLISRRRQICLVVLSLTVTLSYGAESLSYIPVSSSASKQALIHSISQTLLWMSLTLVLKETTSPVPTVYIGTSVLDLLLESLLFVLSFCTETELKLRGITNTSRALRIASILSVACLTASTIFLLLQHGAVRLDQETQSLLSGKSNTSEITGYGLLNDTSTSTLPGDEDVSEAKNDTDSDNDDADDEDNDEEEMLAIQNRRLEENGGWIGYLSTFKTFLPYLIPRNSLKHQVFLVTMFINIVLIRILNVLQPRQIGIVIDKLVRERRIPWKDLLLWFFYSVVSSNDCGLGALNELLQHRISAWSTKELMSASLSHVMSLSMGFHDSKDSGEIIKAIEQAGSLSDVVQDIAFDMAPAAIDVFVALWYLTYLFDVYAMFIAMTMFITYVFVGYHMVIFVTGSRRARAHKERGQSQLIYESVANWFTVSCFNQRKHTLSRLSKSIQDTAAATVQNDDAYTYVFAAEAAIENIGRIGVTILAAYRVAAGTSSIGSLVTLERYWDTITMPMTEISWTCRHINAKLIDTERLLQLFQVLPVVKDKPNAQIIETVRGEVVLSNVEHGYHGRETIIRGLNLSAEPGETIALVGETGSGKSTMFKLLMRFYDVTKGSITIDGQDIRDITLDSLRELFGLVPQDATLFNMSILENVRYGRLSATDEEIYAACRAASIHDKIMSLPRGYASKVGERGVKLSGGERQRIAIARVFLKNPRIVLLDEATSALDSQTESKIQAALKRLTNGRTTFVIAHRLSTILEADKIFVLHEGRVVESGTHAELLREKGKYFDLWDKQAFTVPSET